jgi:predicted small lipoprotein YifL
MRTAFRHRSLVLPLLLAAALSAGALAGCGKKGPLYLPEPARQAERSP